MWRFHLGLSDFAWSLVLVWSLKAIYLMPTPYISTIKRTLRRIMEAIHPSELPSTMPELFRGDYTSGAAMAWALTTSHSDAIARAKVCRLTSAVIKKELDWEGAQHELVGLLFEFPDPNPERPFRRAAMMIDRTQTEALTDAASPNADSPKTEANKPLLSIPMASKRSRSSSPSSRSSPALQTVDTIYVSVEAHSVRDPFAALVAYVGRKYKTETVTELTVPSDAEGASLLDMLAVFHAIRELNPEYNLRVANCYWIANCMVLGGALMSVPPLSKATFVHTTDYAEAGKLLKVIDGLPPIGLQESQMKLIGERARALVSDVTAKVGIPLNNCLENSL